MRIGRWLAANDADVEASHDDSGTAVAVLFVCLGNICRSPTAEGVFRAALNRAGIANRVRAESAGLGDWHVGAPPDKRAIDAARRRGYDLSTLRGRKVEKEDFLRFDWILCMDESNLRTLNEMKPDDFSGLSRAPARLRSRAGRSRSSRPLLRGAEGFDRVLDLIEASAAGLVAKLQPMVDPG
jgi:protein-tyrosine phosphatase